MKISEIRDAYYEASGKVSEIVRQIDLAGVAVIWIFRVGTDSGGIPFTKALLLPLILFVASLGCDLFQYAYKSLLWGLLNYVYWKKHKKNEKDVVISELVNWPTIGFFWIKTALAVAAYVYLLKYIYAQLMASDGTGASG